ncbi:Beta-barrel assembly-enhancing protease [subsurface metagenome]
MMSSFRYTLAQNLLKCSQKFETRNKQHLSAIILLISYRIYDEEKELLLKIATLEIYAKKYRRTIKIINKYLDNNPESIKALKLQSIAYRNMNEHKKAIKILLKSLKISKNDVWILYSLGSNYEKTNKIRMAKTYFRKTIETDKAYSKAYFRLANIYMNEEKFDLAINLFLDGLSLRGESVIEWVNLALCYMKMKNNKAAEKVLLEVKGKKEGLSEVLFALSTCYINQSKYDKAKKMIEQLNQEKERRLILSLKMKLALEQCSYEEIANLLREIKRKEKNAEYWYILAILQANTRRERKAIKSLRKAITMDKSMQNEAKKDTHFMMIRELVEFKHIVYSRQ